MLPSLTAPCDNSSSLAAYLSLSSFKAQNPYLRQVLVCLLKPNFPIKPLLRLLPSSISNSPVTCKSSFQWAYQQKNGSFSSHPNRDTHHWQISTVLMVDRVKSRPLQIYSFELRQTCPVNKTLSLPLNLLLERSWSSSPLHSRGDEGTELLDPIKFGALKDLHMLDRFFVDCLGNVPSIIMLILWGNMPQVLGNRLFINKLLEARTFIN